MANEKILIDANRLKRRLERFEEFMVAFGNVEAAKATRAIINGLKIEPTVDAVEVVRCKYCDNKSDVLDCGNYLCNRKMIGMVRPNDFCSFGGRRTDETI